MIKLKYLFINKRNSTIKLTKTMNKTMNTTTLRQIRCSKCYQYGHNKRRCDDVWKHNSQVISQVINQNASQNTVTTYNSCGQVTYEYMIREKCMIELFWVNKIKNENK